LAFAAASPAFTCAGFNRLRPFRQAKRNVVHTKTGRRAVNLAAGCSAGVPTQLGRNERKKLGFLTGASQELSRGRFGPIPQMDVAKRVLADPRVIASALTIKVLAP
jgi:hypothetical protein